MDQIIDGLYLDRYVLLDGIHVISSVAILERLVKITVAEYTNMKLAPDIKNKWEEYITAERLIPCKKNPSYAVLKSGYDEERTRAPLASTLPPIKDEP